MVPAAYWTGEAVPAHLPDADPERTFFPRFLYIWTGERESYDLDKGGEGVPHCIVVLSFDTQFHGLNHCLMNVP